MGRSARIRPRSEHRPLGGPHLFRRTGASIPLEPRAVQLEERFPAGEAPEELLGFVPSAQEVERRPQGLGRVELSDPPVMLGVRRDQERKPPGATRPDPGRSAERKVPALGETVPRAVDGRDPLALGCRPVLLGERVRCERVQDDWAPAQVSRGRRGGQAPTEEASPRARLRVVVPDDEDVPADRSPTRGAGRTPGRSHAARA